MESVLEAETQLSNHASMSSSSTPPSGSTDSSYDFLSAEEKACLLFLEETIGSLDTEVDSGLSTNESEQVVTPQGPPALPTCPPVPYVPPEESRNVSQHQGHFWSGSHSLPRNVYIGRNLHLRKSNTQISSPTPRSPEGPIQEEQDGQSGHHSRAPAGPLEAVPMDQALIIPPEALQVTQPEVWGCPGEGIPGQNDPTPPQRRGSSAKTMSQKASRDNHAFPSAWGTQELGNGAPILVVDADTRMTLPSTLKSRKLPPNIILKSSRANFHSEPQNWLLCLPEEAPIDTTPVSSIRQEQSRARREALQKLGLPQDIEGPGAQPPTPSSSLRPRGLQGLAQASANSRPVVSKPGVTATSERSPVRKVAAQGPAPEKPPSTIQEPTREKSPSTVQGPVPGKAPSTVQGPAPGKPPKTVQGPGSEKPPSTVQGPAPWKSPSTAQRSALGKVPEARSLPVLIPKTPGVRGEGPKDRLGPVLTLQDSDTPGLRQMSFKSKTLERSGVGLSSDLWATREPSPPTSNSLGKGSILTQLSSGILHDSRPSPTSLGASKDLVGIPVGRLANLEQKQSPAPWTYAGQSRAKLPRAPCVSVRIAPKGVPEEHRKEALRKLGLLKD